MPPKMKVILQYNKADSTEVYARDRLSPDEKSTIHCVRREDNTA